MSYTRTKRLVDLVLAVPALVISLPIQAVVAGIIAKRLGRPVLFRQTRPGLTGRPFVLLKFRTMLPVDRAKGLIDDSSRMTDVGRRLRSSSFDELPSLWNVIRGDLSLVGPRPLLVEYLDRYTPEQGRRHDVKPGLTGLAQIAGRNAVNWEQRLALDLDYVRHQSLRLDFKILVSTISLLVRREGITAQGHPTMTKFLGTATHRGDAA